MSVSQKLGFSGRHELGGGFGLEHQSQLIRYRPVDELAVTDEGEITFGPLVRAEAFIDSRDVVTSGAWILRGGVPVNLSARIVLRAGYWFLPVYLDAPAPQSIEVGIGYRF